MKTIMGQFLVKLLTLSLVLSSEAWACRMALPQATLPKKLISFQTCQALENHINTINKTYAYGGRGRSLKKGLALKEVKAKPSRSNSFQAGKMEADLAAEPASPTATTGTNNQVKNVDEADFVKFNGSHIFQLHKGSLKVLKAWPASDMNLISSVAVQGQPQEMLINSDNAVVLANSSGKLMASIYGIEDVKNIYLKTAFEIPGTYKTARLVDDTLRIVNREYAHYNSFFRTRKVSSSPWFDKTINSPTVNIKPTIQVTKHSRQEIDTTDNCQNVLVPEKARVSSLSRIISIDLKNKSYDETLAYVDPQTVYMSNDNIYLAGIGYGKGGSWTQQQTAIHKFSLQKKNVNYQATGVVNGNLVNQFAMDEYKGDLRVATNSYEKNEKNSWERLSRVQVLRQKSKNLASIGKTTKMGSTEKLYSVRFDKDKAYVVTFRQIDPLYTLDLSNPRRPKVMGELKVPGFSTYIHKLGENHLLTIGKDADEKTGRARGLKLSIFDVTDFRNPKEVKSLIFKKGVNSEASYEHKAFSFYAQKGVLAIPANSGSQSNALLLFDISKQNIQFKGELDMTDMFSHASPQNRVRRSFFADNVVYAIGESGVRAATLSRPQSPLATVHFDKTMAQITW